MSDFRIQRTRVKFCGMTRLEDALYAAYTGADAVGFIFFPKSPRNIKPEKAAEISRRLPVFIDRIGVFVDADFRDIVKIAEQVQLSAIQLHGSESPQFCAELRCLLPWCRIIKAFRVGDSTEAEDFILYNELVDAFLLDTYVKGTEGGTGISFDWNIISKLNLQKPYLLAGGLDVSNISLALEHVHPWCLDVNSGVESEPGIKNHPLINQVLRIVREMDGELG